MNGYPRMPSRVNAIKWLGVLQLIHGILIFIVSLVLFSIDFQENKTSEAFIPWTIPGFIVAFFALGSGSVGASMSRYEGLIHNVSSKQTHMALSVMNAFSAIMYMAVVGTRYFYLADEGATIGTVQILKLENETDTYKASFALMVVIFVLSFFDMVVAFISAVLCAFWVPKESTSAPSPFPSERYAEDPYVIREERVPYSRSHTGAYGRSQYDYYNGGYGRLPALKY